MIVERSSCGTFDDEIDDKLVSSIVDTVVGNGISPTELSKQAALKLSLCGF